MSYNSELVGRLLNMLVRILLKDKEYNRAHFKKSLSAPIKSLILRKLRSLKVHDLRTLKVRNLRVSKCTI